MSWTVTLGGQTFTDANVEGTAYADEATGFPAILAAIAEEARFFKGIGLTSATWLNPATGQQAFATHQDETQVTVPIGALAQARSQSDPGRFMIGTVSSFTEGVLVLEVTLAGGGGASDWVIGYPSDALGALTADLDVNGFAIVSDNDQDVRILPHGTAATRVKNLAATGPASFDAEVSIAGTATLTAGMRMHAGAQWNGTDLGVRAGSVDLAAADDQFLWLICGDDVILDCAAPATGFGYGKIVKVVQDGVGGRAVSVRRAGDQFEAVWTTDPVDWTNRLANDWDYLSVVFTPAGDLLAGHLVGGP